MVYEWTLMSEETSTQEHNTLSYILFIVCYAYYYHYERRVVVLNLY